MRDQAWGQGRPADRPSADLRAELHRLFERPPSEVTVVVKKRRLVTEPPTEPLIRDSRSDPAPAPAGVTVARGPKVHRLTAAAAQAAPAPASERAGEGARAAPGAAGPTQRTARADRRAARQPSSVRIVVPAPALAPAITAAAGDRPAWQRMLCMPPAPVSYRQVLQALQALQNELDDARRARCWRFEARRT